VDFVTIAEGLSDPFGYVVLFCLVLVLSASLFLPLPVFAIVVAAAGVLDPFWVGIVAGVASAIGELSGYFIGVGSEKILDKKDKEGKRYEKAVVIFKKYGFWGIVAAAIFPITPIDFIGLIAGALRYGWKKFLLAAIIGKIPRYMLVAYMGKSIVDMFLFS
jgi:membrane protein YqaA with SNARE-associated domain